MNKPVKNVSKIPQTQWLIADTVDKNTQQTKI